MNDLNNLPNDNFFLKRKNINWIVFSIISTALIVGSIFYLLQIQKKYKYEAEIKIFRQEMLEKISNASMLQEQINQLKNQISLLEKEIIELSSKNSIDEYKIFTNDKLGISFQYPSYFGDVLLEIASSTGGCFRGHFSDVSIEFGGVDDAFSAPRSGNFLDTRGFTKENNIYYYKFVGSKPDNYEPLDPLKIIEHEDGEILILDKDSFIDERSYIGNGEFPPGLNPQETNLGALINLLNDDFTGVAFWNKDVVRVPLSQFEEMLKTVKRY